MGDIIMTFDKTTQSLPPAIQTLKSTACAKDLGASNHVCKVVAIVGVSPSSTGDHTLSGFAAYSQQQSLLIVRLKKFTYECQEMTIRYKKN